MANLSFAKIASVGNSGLTEGRIYFETSTGLIKVATSATTTQVFGGVRSASYSNDTKELIIINQTGETITIDFSDVASATSVATELGKKLNIGTDADASSVQSYYGLKKYVDEAEASALTDAKAYTDEKIGAIPAAIVYKADGTTITQSGDSTVTFTVGTIEQSNVSGLESALAGKAAATHTHTKAQITDFDESDYATAEQGSKADTALQSISASGSGALTLKAAAKAGTTQSISGSIATADVVDNSSTALTTGAQVKSYVDTQIAAAQVAALKYKGSCTYAELPEEPAQGDVWNVEDAHDNIPAGTNYAWDGEKWDPLAGTVDLSPYLLSTTAASTYATQTALTSGLAEKANVEHTHNISDVTNLQTTLDSKVPTSRTINGTPLTSNVTLSGNDINVGGSADHASETIATAISELEDAIAEAQAAGVTSFGGQTGQITVNTAAATNGQVKFTMSEKQLTGTVVGLGSAAYTESSAYDAAGTATTKADAALTSAKAYADSKWVWAEFE